MRHNAMKRPLGLIVVGIWNLLLGSVGLYILFDIFTRGPAGPPLGSGEDRTNLLAGVVGLFHFASGVLVWIRKPMAWRVAITCQWLIVFAEAAVLLLSVYIFFYDPWGGLIILLAVPLLFLFFVSCLCLRYLSKVTGWFMAT
jgi:hypothetical protein